MCGRGYFDIIFQAQTIIKNNNIYDLVIIGKSFIYYLDFKYFKQFFKNIK